MSDLDQLLSMLDVAIGKKPVATPSPEVVIWPRITIVRSWLSDSTKYPDSEYDHLFNPPVGHLDHFNYYKGFIIHNHEWNQPCATPYFCFEYGYRPPDSFVLFWQMNGKYYGRSTPTPTAPIRTDFQAVKDEVVLPSKFDPNSFKFTT